jgi:lipoic acid synthetase
MERSESESAQRLPSWFRQELPDPAALARMRSLLRNSGLHTVCEGAHCPNLGQCWNKGSATFMILGDVCTRGCRFCAVTSGTPSAVDPDEPRKVAEAVRALGLRYAVVTSVTRDDLDDEGAGQFAQTVPAIRELSSEIKVEVLIPDLHAREALLEIVAAAEPDVIGHNIETVRRLSPDLRPQANHDRSLQTLTRIHSLVPDVFVKSGLMVGLGETDDEVLEAFDELKAAGCDIVTVGQYLAPSETPRHLKVERFVSPDTFEMFRREGLRQGFGAVIAGPMVRSSYMAEEGFHSCSPTREGLIA